MKKEQPIYEIEGTQFLVDVAKDALVQKDNPTNVVSFREMTYTGTGYEFHYDKTTKTLSQGFYEGDTNIAEVKIPELVKLDAKGMSERYGVPLEKIKDKSDFDLVVDKELVRQRLSGILPRIDIAGKDFFIDVRLSELRPVYPKNDFVTRIELNKLQLSGDGDYFLCFYRPKTKEVVTVDETTITELPPGVVMLKIPGEHALDPVGFAREYDLNFTRFLRANPPQRDLAAAVIPLSETGLPQIIKRNLEEINLQQNQPAEQQKPSKGKHL